MINFLRDSDFIVVIRDAAKAMVTSGLNQLGYEYINVDDCWAYSRDANG